MTTAVHNPQITLAKRKYAPPEVTPLTVAEAIAKLELDTVPGDAGAKAIQTTIKKLNGVHK